MADSEARSQSSVKNKRVDRDFSAEEVIRLVEDEDGVTKTCQITHFMKMTMKETGRREGVGMLLTKFHIYSLITTSHCAKYTQNYHKRKERLFSFQNSMGFAYFFTTVWSL